VKAPADPDSSLFELPYSPEWHPDEKLFFDNEHRYTKMHRLLRQRLGTLDGARIVDLGCCRGQLLQRFRRYRGVELTGLEIDPTEIQLARRRGIEPIRAFINRFRGNQMTAALPFEDEDADVVLAGEIIEHVVDTESLLREIARILRPGGELVLTTPNVVSLKHRLQLARGRYPDCLDYRLRYGDDFGHVRAFTPEIVAGLLEETGFRDVEVVGQRIGPLSALFGPLGRLLDRMATAHAEASECVIALARRP
jgi:SAM-dependent methyltransferase